MGKMAEGRRQLRVGDRFKGIPETLPLI